MTIRLEKASRVKKASRAETGCIVEIVSRVVKACRVETA